MQAAEILQLWDSVSSLINLVYGRMNGTFTSWTTGRPKTAPHTSNFYFLSAFRKLFSGATDDIIQLWEVELSWLAGVEDLNTSSIAPRTHKQANFTALHVTGADDELLGLLGARCRFQGESSCCHQRRSLSEGLLFWNMGYLSVRQASLWPSRTGVVHLVVKGKCSAGDGERNYSSFASLGVRRRDPAYRSDSWTAARMVAPRDDFLSEKERHHPVTCVHVGPVVGKVFGFTGVEHW